MYEHRQFWYAEMTPTGSRRLRRSKKLRALRLMSARARARRSAALGNDESMDRIRDAVREWGGLAPLPVPDRGRY
jgi:hypothetical protein